jgi:hypothetical protein
MTRVVQGRSRACQALGKEGCCRGVTPSMCDFRASRVCRSVVPQLNPPGLYRSYEDTVLPACSSGRSMLSTAGHRHVYISCVGLGVDRWLEVITTRAGRREGCLVFERSRSATANVDCMICSLLGLDKEWFNAFRVICVILHSSTHTPCSSPEECTAAVPGWPATLAHIQCRNVAKAHLHRRINT